MVRKVRPSGAAQAAHCVRTTCMWSNRSGQPRCQNLRGGAKASALKPLAATAIQESYR